MLLLGSSGTGSHGEGSAYAVDLDGTNDYLSRASDLTGNADGNTFTFSAWFYIDDLSEDFTLYTSYQAGYFFRVVWRTSGTFEFRGKSPGGVENLLATFAFWPAKDTMYNVLASMNLANTGQRAIYLLDAVQSVSYSSYSATGIHFTTTNHFIGDDGAGVRARGRLAHVFLDYTYRDLSNVTNRRLFITSDRKPAQGQAALNPILYLPMDDPSTAHINQGTGGNFTLNGTIARSGRGPNQFNAPYSDLDGAADYLSRTSITGIADGKAFTCAFEFQPDIVNSQKYVIAFGSSGTHTFRVFTGTSGELTVQAYDSSGNPVLDVSTQAGTFVINRNYTVVFSCDMSNVSSRLLTVNGSSVTTTWSTYLNTDIDFSIATTPRYYVGASTTPGNYFNGRLGNVFFHTSYIDLSVPANLAKFVTGTGIDAKPADLGANGELPFGTAPLIYLPMYGNDAGKNYGTGGDFTVNSGPYPGARGPNEFWGNKATIANGTGKYLSKAGLTGISDSTTWSFSGWFRKPDTGAAYLISFDAATVGYRFLTIVDDNGQIRVRCCNSSENNWVLGWTSTSTTVTTSNTDYCIQVSRSGTTLNVYVNGVSISGTFDTQTATATNLASKTCFLGVEEASTSLQGVRNLSEFYFTTDYIDFSQEANRLLFRDAFGNPTDLPAAIAKGTVPNPAIYMRFDPANQGLNSGTGGNFTKSGTITDGGQL